MRGINKKIILESKGKKIILESKGMFVPYFFFASF